MLHVTIFHATCFAKKNLASYTHVTRYNCHASCLAKKMGCDWLTIKSVSKQVGRATQQVEWMNQWNCLEINVREQFFWGGRGGWGDLIFSSKIWFTFFVSWKVVVIVSSIGLSADVSYFLCFTPEAMEVGGLCTQAIEHSYACLLELKAEFDLEQIIFS